MRWPDAQRPHIRRLARGWPCWLLLALLLAACAPANVPATPTLPPLTRVVSVSTPTATPPPPSATSSPTATATLTPTASPVPPTATSTVPPLVSFMAVGDLMLARTIGERTLANGPAWPFAGVIDQLSSADLLVGNLECVIGDQGRPQPKAYTFHAPPVAAEALTLAGFDLVGLANNHALDYGIDGLADMLPRLREAGIETAGAGADSDTAHSPTVLRRNGVSVAFLAYVDVPVEGRTGFDTRSWEADPVTPGVAWADADQMAGDIAKAEAVSDVVVVLLHFGLEGRGEVTPDQERLAHAAIDAGAGLVIGAHTHVLQRTEEYGGGLIVYNLGNFVFDGFGEPSNYSAIFKATLTPSGVSDYSFVPVMVDEGVPRLATPAEAEVITARLSGGG
jgi:poly-gamma-glutamate capsule biosynthesis protein CapA/YwtB (metallophosphatase superfamily)